MELPLPIDIITTERDCKLCGVEFDDDATWKTLCSKCYQASKSYVNISAYTLDLMSINDLGQLPMTWGEKYKNIPINQVPVQYLMYASSKMHGHLHIFTYLKKIFLS